VRTKEEEIGAKRGEKRGTGVIAVEQDSGDVRRGEGRSGEDTQRRGE
jgi:hypothetical protein